jgi:CRP-like cAMP-binding protein
LRGAGKERYTREMEDWLERCQAEVAQTAAEDGNLLAMAERVAILRSVSLFAETPDKTLQELASLLTPVEFPACQTIFHKGEPGDCLYIIVSGKIHIHDGDLILNNLGPADVFGEMALLESEPRVASATVLEPTRLLRLNQGDFYSLMESRPEVARGILLVLSRRLRGRVRDMKEDFLYIQQVGKVTSAAAALEAGLYDPHALDEVSQRPDELGQLARVFQRMAGEVQARERRLKAEVQELRIQIDEAKRATQVAQITESEYFQQLQERVRELRRRN